MWVEERTHDRRMELTAMERVDPHRCVCSHHKCIQHQAKVPIQDRKLNKDGDAIRRHPLKKTQKHGSEKY